MNTNLNRLAAFGLGALMALGIASVAPSAAVAQEQGPTSLGGMSGQPPAMPRLAPFARTRAIIQAQNATGAGRGQAIGGAESQKMVDNYIASIGKGGAGAPITGVGEGASFATQ